MSNPNVHVVSGQALEDPCNGACYGTIDPDTMAFRSDKSYSRISRRALSISKEYIRHDTCELPLRPTSLSGSAKVVLNF